MGKAGPGVVGVKAGVLEGCWDVCSEGRRTGPSKAGRDQGGGQGKDWKGQSQDWGKGSRKKKLVPQKEPDIQTCGMEKCGGL